MRTLLTATLSAVLSVSLGVTVLSSSASAQTVGHSAATLKNRELLQQGISAQAAGNYAAAETAYREAIRLDSTDAVAYYNLGNALADQSKVEAAIAAYQTAIQLDPNNADAYY
ncbi:MAG: tetratricopeptide repeat protein, partial [Phormidesmis sp.]